jgi:hypothetical protein
MRLRNFPGAQDAHVRLFFVTLAGMYPARHRQACTDTLATAGANEFFGQFQQLLLPDAFW